jgi:hypothetical protein
MFGAPLWPGTQPANAAKPASPEQVAKEKRSFTGE